MELAFEHPPNKFAATVTLPYKTTKVVYWVNSNEGIFRVEAFDETKPTNTKEK